MARNIFTNGLIEKSLTGFNEHVLEYSMPKYTFEDTKTGKTFIKELKMDERETFLEENPNVIQVLIPPSIVDPVGIGVTKPPADFQKYVLGKVKEKNPLGSVEKRWTLNKEI